MEVFNINFTRSTVLTASHKFLCSILIFIQLKRFSNFPCNVFLLEVGCLVFKYLKIFQIAFCYWFLV